MIKAKWFLIAGAAGVLATFAVMSTSGTAQTPGARTFTLFELDRSGTFRFIDNPPRAFRNGRGSVSPGDIATVRTPLLTRPSIEPDGSMPHVSSRSQARRSLAQCFNATSGMNSKTVTSPRRRRYEARAGAQ